MATTPAANVSAATTATSIPAPAPCLNMEASPFAELWADLSRGRSDQLDAFLSGGGDPRAQFFAAGANLTVPGLTLLMAAAGSGSKKLVERLLPLSDANAADDQGRTALTCAMSNAKIHASLALLPHSNVNARRQNGQTSLCQAIYRDWSNPSAEQLLRSFLAAGADPNAPGMIGRTALHQALAIQSFKAARVLAPLSDVTLKDENGVSAWGYAKSVAIDCGWWEVADAVIFRAPRAHALKFAAKHGWGRFPEFSRHLAQEEAIALSKSATPKKRGKGEAPADLPLPRRAPRL